jgi:5-hydroxyisourate hydrolase
MNSFSTHVLDTMHGRPASGMEVILTGPEGEATRTRTNADGRCPELASKTLQPGRYALIFMVDDYFRGLGVELTDPAFLEGVVVHFGIAENGGHYHVPLLVSPYGYSTYRGS